jgi:hypothetical protein
MPGEEITMFRQLSEIQILAWANAYREATGHWPSKDSGAIAGTICETWAGVDQALRLGQLGLPGGSSLAQLLAQPHFARSTTATTPLSQEQVLAWADEHFDRTGTWPTSRSGPVLDVPHEYWNLIDDALRQGARGLPAGSSLAQLLAEQRGVRNRKTLPRLTEEKILAWADAFHQHTGQWPTATSGLIPNSGGETWMAINMALRKSLRGLPGGSSLAELLAQQRGVRNRAALPRLTEEQILAWADAFHQETGNWPTTTAGPIPDSGGETWDAVATALRDGNRGLPGGSSLARLLADRRAVRNVRDLPDLTIATVLSWADAHFERTGEWPRARAGAIPEAPGENWLAIDAALAVGRRGLPGGTTLARLLAVERGRRNTGNLPPLRQQDILAWADAHFQRNGAWPTADSGAIAEAPGETWMSVETALRNGQRGLPGDSSVARLLARHRGRRNPQALPPLRINQILAWADPHLQRTGQWPTADTGPIPEAPAETWARVDNALRDGLRGLPGGESLARLLSRSRGVRNLRDLPPLTVEQILLWADYHRQQTGDWPSGKSGSIPGTGETWMGVDQALRAGCRGLPGGSTLAQLLAEHRGKRNRKRLPQLTLKDIRKWARAYRQATGRWPTSCSGPIAAAPGETWNAVECALRKGTRGLPGGSSLKHLLADETQ